MKPTTSQNDFDNAINELRTYFGDDLKETIYIIDFYTRYYIVNELQKRELKTAIDDYRAGHEWSGIEQLIKAAEQSAENDERSSSAISDDFFVLSLLKKFIATAAVHFGQERQQRELLKEFDHQ